ncbi:PEP-CTERM sorting domain-containing protein [bacterium]|nr:PEP-CTERM sorting domain-containing protein [bacterium]MCP5462820.1 PEP-CTERM sorting domain-containing protein [bacterium]
MKKIVFMLCVIVIAASNGHADSRSNTYKWSQLPDLSITGRDIGATEPTVLADDWECLNGLPITDIHWWGSYLGWEEANPTPDTFSAPHPDAFNFSMHTDVPLPNQFGYSFPGQLINGAQALQGQYTVELIGTIDKGGIFEHVFQYNFDLTDPWFQQQGLIYWLDISASYNDPIGNFLWGWHTAKTQWNDSAVIAIPGAAPGWIPIEPTGEKVDLAFELSTVPEPGVMILFGFGIIGWFVRRRNRM